MEIHTVSLDLSSEKSVLTVTNIDLVKLLGGGEWDFLQIHNEIKNTTNHKLKSFLIEVMKSLGEYYCIFDQVGGDLDREEVIMYYGKEYVFEEYDIPEEEREEYIRRFSQGPEVEIEDLIDSDHDIQMREDMSMHFVNCHLSVREIKWNPSIIYYIYEHIEDFVINAGKELALAKENRLGEADFFVLQRIEDWENLYSIFSELLDYKKNG